MPSTEPVPIDKVSSYDRSVPARVRIPRVTLSLQENQLDAIRNRMYRYLKRQRGRKEARQFKSNYDSYAEENRDYHRRKSHLEYLMNLYIQQVTDEVQRIAKSVTG